MIQKLFFIIIFSISIVPDTIAQNNSNKDLILINTNYKRIEAIKKWTQTKEIIGYKAYDEGLDNKVTAFYTNNKLEKIRVILYREMSKKEILYYFLNNELSFVVDKLTTYSEPYQTKDSKTLTDKLWFANKELIHLVDEQNSGWDMPPIEEVYNLFQEEVYKIIKAK